MLSQAELAEAPAPKGAVDLPRLFAVCRRSPGRADGIRDHAFLLVKAMNATGRMHAELLVRADDGSWDISNEIGERVAAPGAKVSLSLRLSDCDALLIHYNPFMFGRWGLAPWLPLALIRLRFSRERPRIILMVHEPFVPMIGWRWTLMGLYQRLQLLILHFAADVVFASIEAWTDRLGRWLPHRQTFHLPVGSNLPDKRHFRGQHRQWLVGQADDIVLATFGQSHPARLTSVVVEAANLITASGKAVVLLNLGASPPVLVGLDRKVVVHAPGLLPAEQVARWLAAADIYLGPFVDGASTRRATLMAAMQHGLPVVSTDGPLTDAILRNSGALRLVPISRLELFAESVLCLANSPEDRRILGNSARDLYVKHFDWPTIAAKALRGLAFD